MSGAVKRTAVLVLAVALAIGISACGGSSDSGSSDTGATVKPEELSGTVTVWDIVSSFSPTYAAAAKKLDAAFEQKYPNLTVDHVDQPFENYAQIYRAAFTGHQGPDVMNFPAGAFGVLSYTDGLEPLNRWISPQLEAALSGWEATTADFKPDGDHYGVPVNQNAFVYYYNKDLFAKAGLPREFEPQSWDELKAAAEKLKAAGIEPFVGGNKEGFENGNWFNSAWQTINSEEQSVELGTGEMAYTDQPVTEAFGPLIEFEQAGLFPQDFFTTPKYPSTEFAEAKGAITLGQIALAAYYGEFVPQLGADNVGMFFAPASEYIGTEPNWAWGIPKFAEDKDAAWAYVEFLTSREGMQMLADLNPGEIPNRKDVELPASLPPQAGEILAELRQRKTFPLISMFMPGVVLETLWKEGSQVLQGRTSLEDAQGAMQEAAEKAS